ncbi:hypothetical protein [Gallaecimonas pentaromativorans]|uniref:hypothetical protein n=1 Tax=Gallaecimonas pentaromativorans TaxID=584787 RepID=UPI003A8DAC3D
MNGDAKNYFTITSQKMTLAFHAYLNSEDTELNESSTISEMKSVFKNNTRVLFSEKMNTMTKKSGLKITVDDVYNISAFFDSGSNVEQDFNDIQDEPHFYFANIRELFKNNHRTNYEVGLIQKSKITNNYFTKTR